MRILPVLLIASNFCFLTLSLPKESASQNVGIGTTSPDEKLHVAGNIKSDTAKHNAIKLTPNAGAGKILTSDALGNGTWQTNATASGNVGFGVWGDCATNGNIINYQPVADDSGEFGDKFGNSVSVSGNYAIVGTPGDMIGGNTGQGSVSIYQNIGGTWVLFQKISDATGAAGDGFGHSVNIAGNFFMAGAPFDDVGATVNQGSVSIYQFNGSLWVLMQKIVDGGGAFSDEFGQSVSISGNHAVVGAPGDDIGANSNQGSASFYRYDGINWILAQKSAEPAGAANDNFGKSVSVSGNYAIIGVPNDNVTVSNTNQGSAIIYQFNGVSAWNLIQKIADATGASGDNFGSGVSISGNYLIGGAPGDDVGSNNDQGSCSIFQFNGSNWSLMQKIDDVYGVEHNTFGYSVSISGNYAIVGAPFTFVPEQINQGCATIYQRIGMGWQKLQFIIDPGGDEQDFAGNAVGIDGITKQFIIGAYGFINVFGKVVFGKLN
ncbi:MAG TPA: hypothetical protein VGO58_03340 [Chitinophagaceae bacterium]|jgi:hypothetical protein|nr:hypothetical protein [Chitinophagaceae bacterium]